jgi:tyrosyl-tRNA synthetase
MFPECVQADVNTKIKKAYCPPGELAGNPCLEYIQYVVLPWYKEFTIKRKEQDGGDK